jgi:tRNA-binding protein
MSGFAESQMNTISWEQYQQIDLRVGTVIAVDDFPEARKPAFKVTVDFGPEVGIKRTSAQVTALYSRDDLVGRQVIGVVNFPLKQIGPFVSEFLLTGFYQDDGAVVLAVPDQPVINGRRLV